MAAVCWVTVLPLLLTSPWPAAPSPPPGPQDPFKFTGSYVHDRSPDATECSYAVAFKGASWTDPDSIPLMVMQTMLGRWTQHRPTSPLPPAPPSPVWMASCPPPPWLPELPASPP